MKDGTRALGINTRKMTVFGLMLSNALIALPVAILAQNNGYADVKLWSWNDRYCSSCDYR